MKGGSRDNSLRVPPGVRRDFIAPLSRGIKLKNDPPASAKPICQRRKLIERSISRGPRSVFAWQGNNRIASPNLVIIREIHFYRPTMNDSTNHLQSHLVWRTLVE